MAVFRIEKTKDYTVMSNYHLRDRSLSLKAKGLLSLMLSLPEDWDYTMKGLARICKDGIDSISGGIRELEAHGYLVRARVRNENGQLGSIEYTILEQPKEPAQTPAPIREKPIRENPIQVKPMLDAPIQENPAQLNTKEQNKELSITQGSSPIPSSPPTPREKSRIGQDRMRERESYREIILENIDYDILTQDEKLDRDRLDELVELMVDTVCSNREMIRIAGDGYPAEVVKSRFLKIDSSHIEYVLERMRENTTYLIQPLLYLPHIRFVRAASGVDPLGDLIDVPANGGQGSVHPLDIRGVKLDDIPVYRHLPQIRAIPPCGELRHLSVNEPFFLLRHIELHLNIPLSVRYGQPPFLIRVWGLACRLGRRFKAFHALRSPPETRAPASNFDCSGKGPEQRKIRKRVLACCAC